MRIRKYEKERKESYASVVHDNWLFLLLSWINIIIIITIMIILIIITN